MIWVGHPAGQEVRLLAGRLTRGVLVVVNSEDAVRAGRRAAADLDNVMFVAESETGELPWQDSFFTLAIAPAPTGELRRVLDSRGRIVSAGN